MHECDYCEASFEDEDAYLDHLAEAHEGELGAIDRRRVASHQGDGGFEIPAGPALVVGIVVGTLALVGVVVVVFGGGDVDAERTPDALGTAHGHGTINVTVGGERLDFSRQEFQVQDDYFHFENGNGTVWHTHATGVTLEYAMATLGIDVGQNRVVYRQTVYEDGDGAEVVVEVNGEPVDPTTYELQGASDPANAGQGDHVRIVARNVD